MRWQRVVSIGAILFLAGFLFGFIPQRRRASLLNEQWKTAQLQDQLSEIRELALLSYFQTSRLNYVSARDASERMFSRVTQLANGTDDHNLKSSLDGLETFHDPLKAKLTAADPSALHPLQQLVQKTQAELKR
jgi:hypothetical protein